jgi:hypothetical protein
MRQRALVRAVRLELRLGIGAGVGDHIRALPGRALFEGLIRDHLDVGRPDQAAIIFDRRATKVTTGLFRTKVLPEGLTPSCAATTARPA